MASNGPTVNLSIRDDDGSSAELELIRRQRLAHDSTFYTQGRIGTAWSVGQPFAVTDLAYRWLVRDLEVVGLLEKNFRFT